MMHCLRGFAAAAIDAFDLIANVPVVVLLSQLGGSAVRRASGLRRQLIPLLGRPPVSDFAHRDVELTELLVDNQVFQPLVPFHPDPS